MEVFLINGGALSDSDYYGVYALTEKISRDEDWLPWIAYFLSMSEPAVVAGIFSRLTVRIPAIPDSMELGGPFDTSTLKWHRTP